MLHPSTAWRLYRLPDERVVQYGLRDDCVTDGAVSQGQPDSTLRDCCCCHTKLAHSVLKTVSAWCWCMNCATTAWLMPLCLLPVLHSDCVTDAAVTCTEAHEWGKCTGCLMRELYSMDCVTTAWLMVLSHKGSLILHCVTVAAATPSLHTQSWKRFLPGVGVWTAWRLRDWCCCAYRLYCIATAWLMQLSHVQRPMSGESLQAAWWESCTVWTAWRLRDWWCCLTMAAWFYTAWLLLLPHQACTLSPENSFCLVLVYELRDDCVTDAAWLMWLMSRMYRCPWVGGVDPQVRIPDCVTIILSGLRCWWCCCRTGAIWSECVTTAWLMLRPRPACTSSLTYYIYSKVPGFCRQCVTTALMLLLVA